MKRFIYLLGFVVFVFGSCNKDSEFSTETNTEIKPDGKVSGEIITNNKYEGYIQAYVDADSVNVFQCTKFENLCPCIYLYLEGMVYDWTGFGGYDNYARKVGAEFFVYDKGVGSLPSHYTTANNEVLPVNTDELSSMVRDNEVLYKKYSEQLGDTVYSNTHGRPDPTALRVIVNKISEINVVCNEDFDAEHPKGSSVSDILTFYGSTPVDYIKRVYKWGERSFDNLPKGVSYVYELIKCKASEIAEKNIEFFDYYFFLNFEKQPENSGTYTFDIVIKFTDKELKETVTMQF